jgi:hypothetical protein
MQVSMRFALDLQGERDLDDLDEARSSGSR